MLATVYYALSGLFIGSFINVCADRLPRGLSIVRPPSHCEACDRTLSWYELLPVLSYVALRGRCRTCGARIPWRLSVVEMATGALFGYIGFQHGVSAQGVVLAFYSATLVLIAVMDLQHLLVLNVVVIPAALLALVLSPLLPDIGPLDPLYGALIGFGAMLAVYMAARGGMGAGDVKLAAFIGTATGFPLVIVNLVLAVVIAGVVAVLLLLFKLKSRKDFIPFGPFLAGGAIVTLLWGDVLLDAYLDLLGW